jgi:hypothetical protein
LIRCFKSCLWYTTSGQTWTTIHSIKVRFDEVNRDTKQDDWFKSDKGYTFTALIELADKEVRLFTYDMAMAKKAERL